MLSLTSKDLVQEDLDVVGAEMLRTDDDLVKIALKQLGDHISAVTCSLRNLWIVVNSPRLKGLPADDYANYQLILLRPRFTRASIPTP